MWQSGDAVSSNAISLAICKENTVFFTSSAVATGMKFNDGTTKFGGSDGVIMTYSVTIPDNVQPGDVYPITFKYVSTPAETEDSRATTDLFTNREYWYKAVNENAEIDEMTEYAINNWVNGYIKIGEKRATTTVTTTITTAKPTTTTIKTTTTTAKPTTTTVKTTSTTEKLTTTTAKPTATTTKLTTTLNTTTQPPVTTTKATDVNRGDIDDNGTIDAIDASVALTIYALRSTNGDVSMYSE